VVDEVVMYWRSMDEVAMDGDQSISLYKPKISSDQEIFNHLIS